MKMQWKRGTVFLMSFFLFFVLLQMTDLAGTKQVNAEEAPLVKTITETYVNPYYRDVITEEDLNDPDEYAIAPYGEPEYTESMEEAGEILREQMKERMRTATVYVKTSGDYSDLMDDISSQAMIHTGNPKEGDYIARQYAGWQGTLSGYSSDGYYYLALTYTITYYTTAAQEEVLDAEIEEVISELGLKSQNKTNYEKVRAIYDYICGHVTYDYTNLENAEYKLKYTAYAAMINGTSVCQGYAVLFYRMALESGIDARYISGIGNGGAHGWNIVKLGRKYYNLDATWDSNYAANKNYHYFLKCTANFDDHTRNDEYNTEAFHASYPMDDADYDINHTHARGEAVKEKETAATCTESGSYDSVIYCTSCQEELSRETVTVPARGHTEVTDAAAAATCTESGKTAGKHCSVCHTVLVEQKEINPLGHAYGEGEVTKAADCVTTGEKIYTCSRCNITKEEEIPALGHEEVTDAAAAATCTEDGFTEGSHCSRCKTVLKEQEVVKAAGHKKAADAAIAPTCTKTGKTAGSHCSECGIVFEKQEELKAAGHRFGSWKQTKAATALNAGQQSRTCAVCKAVETRATAKLKPIIKLSAKSLPLQLKKTTTALKVVKMQKGDKIKAFKSSNPKVVKINAKNGKMTAKKVGKATITVTLKSGIKAKCVVKVQKAKVTTKKIVLSVKKMTLRKGKKAVIPIELNPLTSTDKIKITSSNKKIATVTSKGIVTAKKKGTAKITVRSGKKKAVCKVTVK